MNGTAWVEPGQGATVRALTAALCDGTDWDTEHYAACANLNRIAATADEVTKFPGAAVRTNLALTGRSLTAYDVERIANAETLAEYRP